jgi:hypothetical protein
MNTTKKCDACGAEGNIICIYLTGYYTLVLCSVCMENLYHRVIEWHDKEYDE